MPPDRNIGLHRRFKRSREKRLDRNIPQAGVVETRDLRDREVNMQVGAFIAAPVLGIVLVFRPEVYELSAAAFLALLAATRRSRLLYRRLRIA